MSRRLLLGALLAGLALLCGIVLWPFLVPLVWSLILAYVSWPVYRHVRRAAGHRATLAASAMTLLLALVLVLPGIVLVAVTQDELAAIAAALERLRAGELHLPAALAAVPRLGPALQALLDRAASDPDAVRQWVAGAARAVDADVYSAARGALRNVLKLLLTLVTTFFLYRDGAALRRQFDTLLYGLFAHRLDRYLQAAAGMVRAVVYGMLFSALAQGALATLGYMLVGAPAPVLLGALTMLAAVVPVFGTLLIWGPVAAALYAGGQVVPACILLAWGALVVNPADNLIKLLLISSRARMPILLVLFGVVGGIAAFGLVGVFIGPVALAIALALWREAVEARAAEREAPAAPRPAGRD